LSDGPSAPAYYYDHREEFRNEMRCEDEAAAAFLLDDSTVIDLRRWVKAEAG